MLLSPRDARRDPLTDKWDLLEQQLGFSEKLFTNLTRSFEVIDFLVRMPIALQHLQQGNIL